MMLSSKSLGLRLILLLAIGLFKPFAMASNTNVGELELNHSNGQRDLALLLNTHVAGEINGLLASIKVAQQFKNQSDDWVNGRYVFPLPPNAAVDSLTIKIGDRTIQGVIKEKEEAKKTFEAAKRAGKKAGLLEQHRPNLFSISIANIAPHEEIRAEITFIDKVEYQNNTFSLRLPTTLTPRYVPGVPLKSLRAAQNELARQFAIEDSEQIVDGAGWAKNTDRVADATDVTPPQVHASALNETQANQLFSLNLTVNAGLDLKSIESSTHRISTQFIDSKKTKIGLLNEYEKMDSDLVISWKPIMGSEPNAALFQQKFGDAYYSLLMVAPPSANSTLSLPRDITFIVDSSGSMSGSSIRQAKQALHNGLTYLSPSDRFNIIDFDSSYRPLFMQSQAVNAQSLNEASRMIDQLHADGGTEMLGALAFALKPNAPTDDAVLRQIVFITDGAIANEKELFTLLNNQLGDARLFTVGIGSAPNAFFMHKAAKFGRGSYTFIQNSNQVNEQMADLFVRITRPVLRDINIDWQQKNIEQYPSRLPDLYAGQPLSVVVKSDKPISGLTASGKMLNTPWRKIIKNSKSTGTAQNLNTLWARDKVADLMDELITGKRSQEEIKPEIISLGVTHRMVTKFTSFVAVEQVPSKPLERSAKHKNIANLMPKGNTMVIPQTATSATLFAYLGALLMLIGGVLRRRTVRLNAHA